MKRFLLASLMSLLLLGLSATPAEGAVRLALTVA